MNVQKLQELAARDPQVRQAIEAVSELTQQINDMVAPIIADFCKKYPKLPVDLVCGALGAYVGGMAFASGGNLENCKASLEGGFAAARMQQAHAAQRGNGG